MGQKHEGSHTHWKHPFFSNPVFVHLSRTLQRIITLFLPAEEEEKQMAEDDRERTTFSWLLKQGCDTEERWKTGPAPPAHSALSLLWVQPMLQGLWSALGMSTLACLQQARLGSECTGINWVSKAHAPAHTHLGTGWSPAGCNDTWAQELKAASAKKGRLRVLPRPLLCPQAALSRAITHSSPCSEPSQPHRISTCSKK